MSSLEEENLEEWSNAAKSMRHQPPVVLSPNTQTSSNPSANSTNNLSLPSRPSNARSSFLSRGLHRPRTISGQQTTFLLRLSKLHLEWSIINHPALVYALRAVGGVSVKADKTLFTIELPDESCNQPRILMVEKEASLKTILLDSIVSVQLDKNDAGKRNIKIIYWFDKNRRMNAPPTHPSNNSSSNLAPVATSPTSTSSPTAAAASTAKQYLLQLTFSSYLDARDVHILLNYFLAFGCPNAEEIFRAPGGTGSAPAEFVILHAGYLEKKGKSGLTWSKRYARLYAGGRLAIYRTEKSILPVNVLSMFQGDNETRLRVRPIAKDQLGLEIPTSKDAPEVPVCDLPHLFRFESVRDREKWLQALQIDFQQPLKEFLRRPAQSELLPAVPEKSGAEPISPRGEKASAEAGLSNVTITVSAPPALQRPLSSIPQRPPPPIPSSSPSSSNSQSPASATPSPTASATPAVAATSTPSPSPTSTSPPAVHVPIAVSPKPQPVVLTKEQKAKAAAIAAEQAYTYFSQLLLLAASPEILRMGEQEELIIPKDGSCGAVNLSQFSTRSTAHALPQAANPNLKYTKAASLALSAPAATSPLNAAPMQSGSFAAPANAPVFNPQTHLKVTVAELLHKVQDQALYFAFLSYFRSQYSAMLFQTNLPSLQAFQSSTPSASIFNLGKRGSSLQELDRALSQFHAFMRISSDLIKRAKLLCFENEAANASTSSSLIGFSYPGFDSQVFDIGRFSIISPAQMFLGLENSFDDSEWSTAIKASSVGKELMQSCADFTALFESSNSEDQNRARTLMHRGQLEVLHNIALAAHMRAKWAIEKQRLREGDVIAFSDVLAQFEQPADDSSSSSSSSMQGNPALSSSPSSSSSSALKCDEDLFQYSRNHMQLEQWGDVEYVYSAPKILLQQFIKVRMEQWEKEQGKNGGYDYSKKGGGGGTTDTDSVSHTNNSSNSPQSSPRRASVSNSETDGVTLSLNPVHPLQPAIASYSSTRHFLFDYFHYLLFVRLLFDHRKLFLEQIENAAHLWLSKYQKDSSKSKSSEKYQTIITLKESAELEKKKIVLAMNELPSNQTMEGIVKLENRLSTQHTLSTFLPTRPKLDDMGKAAFTAGLTLTTEQADARKQQTLHRKSVVQQHLEFRAQHPPPSHPPPPPPESAQ